MELGNLQRALTLGDALPDMVREMGCCALVARENGDALAASKGWARVGIDPQGIEEKGWSAYLAPEDDIATQVEVAEMGLRAADGFVNHWIADDGARVCLRWHASPWVGPDRIGLSIAEVVPDVAE